MLTVYRRISLMLLVLFPQLAPGQGVSTATRPANPSATTATARMASPAISVRTRTEGFLERITQEGPFSTAPVGMLAVNLRGDTLACWNPSLKLVPASNVKLITCAAALHALGGDWHFDTELAYSGHVDGGGILRGDLYILGGGDPTIGAQDGAGPSAEYTFSRWKALLERSGISSIEGRVIGDGRYISEEACPDWSYEDMGFYYGAMPGGLNFYKNTHDLRAVPGAAPGDTVQISEIYPELPWMIMSHSAVTGPAGSGDRLYYRHSGYTPRAGMYGSLAVDRGIRREQCVNRFGAYTCAAQFCKYLSDRGYTVSGGPADIDPEGYVREDLRQSTGQLRAAQREDLKPIGSVPSPPLRSIVTECLTQSDNFYAEALMMALGKEFTGSAAADSCRTAEGRVLAEMGLSIDDIQIRDGSGLSRKNYVSAEFFVRLLQAISAGAEYGQFLSALPSPGQGSIQYNMSKQGAPLRSRIRMKSGSMDGIRCFSGYILPADGAPEDETVVFSLLTNNVTASQYQVRPVLDRLILLLAQ